MNNGGPAFPIPDQYAPDGTAICHGTQGMTLRDYFAAAALQGMLAFDGDFEVKGSTLRGCKGYATEAYRYADAMLAARAKP